MQTAEFTYKGQNYRLNFPDNMTRQQMADAVNKHFGLQGAAQKNQVSAPQDKDSFIGGLGKDIYAGLSGAGSGLVDAGAQLGNLPIEAINSILDVADVPKKYRLETYPMGMMDTPALQKSNPASFEAGKLGAGIGASIPLMAEGIPEGTISDAIGEQGLTKGLVSTLGKQAGKQAATIGALSAGANPQDPLKGLGEGSIAGALYGSTLDPLIGLGARGISKAGEIGGKKALDVLSSLTPKATDKAANLFQKAQSAAQRLGMNIPTADLSHNLGGSQMARDEFLRTPKMVEMANELQPQFNDKVNRAINKLTSFPLAGLDQDIPSNVENKIATESSISGQKYNNAKNLLEQAQQEGAFKPSDIEVSGIGGNKIKTSGLKQAAKSIDLEDLPVADTDSVEKARKKLIEDAQNFSPSKVSDLVPYIQKLNKKYGANVEKNNGISYIASKLKQGVHQDLNNILQNANTDTSLSAKDAYDNANIHYRKLKYLQDLTKGIKEKSERTDANKILDNYTKMSARDRSALSQVAPEAHQDLEDLKTVRSQLPDNLLNSKKVYEKTGKLQMPHAGISGGIGRVDTHGYMPLYQIVNALKRTPTQNALVDFMNTPEFQGKLSEILGNPNIGGDDISRNALEYIRDNADNQLAKTAAKSGIKKLNKSAKVPGGKTNKSVSALIVNALNNRGSN